MTTYHVALVSMLAGLAAGLGLAWPPRRRRSDRRRCADCAVARHAWQAAVTAAAALLRRKNERIAELERELAAERAGREASAAPDDWREFEGLAFDADTREGD